MIVVFNWNKIVKEFKLIILKFYLYTLFDLKRINLIFY